MWQWHECWVVTQFSQTRTWYYTVSKTKNTDFVFQSIQLHNVNPFILGYVIWTCYSKDEAKPSMLYSHFVFKCCLLLAARHLKFVSDSYLKQLTEVLYLSLLRLHSRQGPYPCLGTREKLSWCSQCHEHRELMTWYSSVESSIIKNQSSLPEELAPGKHNSLSLLQTW